MTNTPLAKIVLGSETLGFVTSLSEIGSGHVAKLDILNRNGEKIQKFGSTGRTFRVSGFVESNSGNMETTKSTLQTFRQSNTTYALTIKSVSSDSKYFINDKDVFVVDVTWTGIMSGTTFDRWFYELELVEDTN